MPTSLHPYPSRHRCAKASAASAATSHSAVQKRGRRAVAGLAKASTVKGPHRADASAKTKTPAQGVGWGRLGLSP
eukprot:scaffold203946_cov26-Tisochrysis_lutea.AAC.1